MKSMRKNGTIVCALPATGKTTVTNMAMDLNLALCDSDSEQHHWIDLSIPRDQRVERPHWIEEYIQHLRQATTEYDFVFASTHDAIRQALVVAEVTFVLVYVTADQKDDIVNRIRNRNTGLHGNTGVALVTKMWDEWLLSMDEQKQCAKVVLQRNQYLSDVLDSVKYEDMMQPFGYIEKVPDNDAPVADNPSTLYCSSCREIGMAHCAHPEECGGMRRMKIVKDSLVEE
jgi:hypothetical protein